MQVFNDLYPAETSQIEALREKGPEGPVFMVNLLRFRDRAEYEDGRASALSGREAYEIYGRAVAEILPRFGGRVVFSANVTFLSLGRAEELWDEVAIAAYPDRGSMVRMSFDSAWREASVHRTAGLKGQLNIETTLAQHDLLPEWLVSMAQDMRG